MEDPRIIYAEGGARLVDTVTQGTPYGAAEVWGLARRVNFNEARLRAALVAGQGSAYVAYKWIQRHPVRRRKG